jgi:hypothetical protein
MGRLVLHIGTHKTGTTALQRSFWKRRELLASHGIIYPDFGTPSGHHGLLGEVNPALARNYPLPKPSAELMADLAARYADSDATVILSSEEFSRGTPSMRFDFRGFRKTCGFDRVEVVAVLRPQLPYLQSVFLELTKNVALDWEKFFQQSLRSGLVGGPYLDFNLLDAHLLTAFRPDEITYLDYDDAQNFPGGTSGAVLAHLGLPPDSPGLDLDQDPRQNVSPQPLVILAALQMTDATTLDGGLLDFLGDVFRDRFGPEAQSTLYRIRRAERVLEHFAPLNAAFRDRITARGGVAPALKMTPLSPETLTADRLDAEFWREVARRFYANLEH